MSKSIASSYNKIAQEYVGQHGYGNQLSIPSLKKFLKYLPDHPKVLDVGCGGGQDAKFLTTNGCDVKGIDISGEMIKIAKKMAPGIDFDVGDVMNFPIGVKYDGVWCCRVFHHIAISEQADFLNKLHALLTPKGVLYITVAVSDEDEDYEANDSGNDGLLKKRLTEKSFKDLLADHGFGILEFNYWAGKSHMEIFLRKKY